MNTRRVIKFIPVSDGDILDLPNTAIPGVGRRGAPTTGTYAFSAPESLWDHKKVPFASITGDHIIIGYQPAPLNPRARKPYEPSGWLIVLVDESKGRKPSRLRRNSKAVA